MSGWTKACGGNPYLQEALHQVKESPAMMYRVTRSFFNATDNSCLRISRGDVVEVEPSEQDEIPPGWLFGRLNGLSGIFPADRVEPIRGRAPQKDSPKPWGKKTDQGRQRQSDASSSSNDSVYELPEDCTSLCVYEAIHNFDAKAVEELSIKSGDFIYVQPSSLDNVDAGWLWGWIGERAGLFPESYVRLVNETEDEGYIHMKENEISPPFGMQKERVRPMRESIDTLMDIIDDSCTDLEDKKEEFLVGRLSKVTSSQEDYKRVLENWDSLIRHLKELLRNLRSNEKVARDDPSQWAVGDILSEKFQQPDKFTKCCNWRKDAEALLQKQSKHLIQKHLAGIFKTSDKSLEMDGAELMTILQFPAKQIYKYPGLIKKVAETTPADHADHECIQAAFLMCKDICLLISKTNEDTKHNDAMMRIQEIVKGSDTHFLSETDCLGQRKLCYTSKLQELKGGQKQDCVGFLLNDQLLLGFPKSAKIPDAYMTDAAKITFQASRLQPFLLNNLEVCHREVSDLTIFTILCYDDLEVISLNLKAPSARERNLWTQKIDEAVKLYTTAKKKRLHSRNQKDADSSRTTYLAKYTFNTDYPQALNFTSGDVLKAGSRQEGANPGWMFGSFSNESGWFPKTLVEPIPETEESSAYNEQIFEVEEPEEVENIPERKSFEVTNQTYSMDQPLQQHALKKTNQFGHADTLPQYSEPHATKFVKPKKASEEPNLKLDIMMRSPRTAADGPAPLPSEPHATKFVKPKKASEEPNLRHDIMMRSPRTPADGPVTLPRPMAKTPDQPKPIPGFINIRESPKLPAKKDRGKEVHDVQKPPIQQKPKPATHLADLQSVLKARKHSDPPSGPAPTDKHVPKQNKQWTPMVAIKPSDLKLRKTSESSAEPGPKPLIPPRRGGPPH